MSRGTVEWFKSYLSGRFQVVRIGSSLSEPLPVTHGLPQGSILGPVLFNVSINDLPLIPTTGSLESFVDDSKLFVSFPIKNINVVTAQRTEDPRKIAAWCCTNSLLINPEKTKLLLGKLQNVQNFAARILAGTKNFQHITPILRELNRLPVHLNVKLRESVMTFKCVISLAPSL